MRLIPRPDLSPRAQKYLRDWTARIEGFPLPSGGIEGNAAQPGGIEGHAAQSGKTEVPALRVRESKRLWSQKSRTRTLTEIREVLVAMNGVLADRCMYCEYSEAHDIDHFVPRSLAPLRTFDWRNMLLACHSCNSNHKRDGFRSPLGALPVDPTAEDPRLHLRFLPVGMVRGRSERGDWTIELFGLSRPFLVKQRRNIWHSLTELLPRYAECRARGDGKKADLLRITITGYPFVSIFLELLAISLEPHAQGLIPHECRAALSQCPEVYDWPGTRA